MYKRNENELSKIPDTRFPFCSYGMLLNQTWDRISNEISNPTNHYVNECYSFHKFCMLIHYRFQESLRVCKDDDQHIYFTIDTVRPEHFNEFTKRWSNVYVKKSRDDGDCGTNYRRIMDGELSVSKLQINTFTIEVVVNEVMDLESIFGDCFYRYVLQQP